MATEQHPEVLAMPQIVSNDEVFTLGEAAAYLRLSEATVELLATRQGLPGRRIDGDWRFLKSAVRDWLKGRSKKESLLRHAGEWADDPTVPELLRRIYEERGRPMTEERDEGLVENP